MKDDLLLKLKMRESWVMLLIIMIGDRMEILGDFNRLECVVRISKLNIIGKIFYLKGGVFIVFIRWKIWFGSGICEDELRFIGLLWIK